MSSSSLVVATTMFVALDTVLFTYVPETGTFVKVNIGKIWIIIIVHIVK